MGELPIPAYNGNICKDQSLKPRLTIPNPLLASLASSSDITSRLPNISSIP